MDEIVIPRWFDRHLHIRDGEMMRLVLPCTLKQRATGALIMGNLKHPDEISTIAKAQSYYDRIMKAVRASASYFQPRLALYLTDDITPDEVERGFLEHARLALSLPSCCSFDAQFLWNCASDSPCAAHK